MNNSLLASPLTWSAVSGLGTAVIGLLPFLHTLLKSADVEARRTRVLKRSKRQLEIWEKILGLQEKVLSGDELEKTKKRVSEAVEHIREQTDATLRALNPTVNPALIPGIPQWRHRLLLYLPKQGRKFEGVFNRLALLLISVLMILLTALFIYATYPRFHAVHGQSRVSHPVLGLMVFLLTFLFLEVILLSVYRSVYEEGAQPIERRTDRL